MLPYHMTNEEFQEMKNKCLNLLVHHHTYDDAASPIQTITQHNHESIPREVDHILKALNTMSSYDVARAREMIEPGTTHHEQLVQKLKDYRLRLT